MRWCWNWQTGMVEGHVPQGVEVQVLSSAPKIGKNPRFTRDFLFAQTAGLDCQIQTNPNAENF